jgi:diguanylate cyclase (GGDEF)-like protein/PAS domain S-box-containing protein
MGNCMNRVGPEKMPRQSLVAEYSPSGGRPSEAPAHENVERSVHALKAALFRITTAAGKRASRLLDRKATAWIVLLLTVMLTLGLWRNAETEFSQREQENFLRVAEKHRDILATRMDDYEQVLRGGAALIAATGMPSREEWRTYVESLELEQTLPGILGTGFAVMVPRETREAHEQSIRAEGFADYAITPAGDREVFSSILYLEPFSGRNLRAFGYDMFSDPVRREAMERARDSGQPALSRKVTLVQETDAEVQPGFLIYFPVYDTTLPRDTVADRRAALIGFVYSPFRAFDLMEGTFNVPGQIIEVELFDGEPVPENLLYASRGAGRAARHVTDMRLEIAGHAWMARFRSSARLEASPGSSQPKLILFGGLALDLLLFSVLYLNARHRRKMREAAARLETILDSYKSLVENIPGAVFRSQAGASSPVLQLSNGIQPLTGEPAERFLSGELSYDQLIHPDDKLKVSETIAEAIARRSAYNIEYRIHATNGYTRWVNERGRVTSDPTGQARWLDGLIFDITERKAAEIMIRDLAFNDTLTGLPNRRLLLDRLEHQLAISERTGRYGALLFIDMDNFKTINDTLGHDAGDQVLVEVSRRLVASVRESDTVARLGGDEFVVILDNLGNTAGEAATEAAELGSKILVVLSQPYRLGEHLRNSTPSIGITTFRGHTASADQLLRQADQAMYSAKSAGRHQLQFYTVDQVAAAGTR